MPVNITSYRRHETKDGSREYVGYDSQLIEDLVREHNALEERVKKLEGKPLCEEKKDVTMSRRKQDIIRTRE